MISSLSWPPLMARQILILAGLAGIAACRFPLHATLALVLLCAVTCPKPAPAKLAAMVLAFLAGLGWGVAGEPSPSAPPAWAVDAVQPSRERNAPFRTGIALDARIREVSLLDGNRLRLLLDDIHSSDRQEPDLDSGIVLTWVDPPGYARDALPGQRLHATLRLREIRSFANPGGFDSRAYWLDRGTGYRAWVQGERPAADGTIPRISGRGKWLASSRQKLVDRVRASLASLAPEPNTIQAQAAALVPALLFGDRSGISRDNTERFARSTLSHSLALSGLHMGYAAALGYLAILVLGRVRPQIFLHVPRQRLAALACLVPATLYLWLGGHPPSLVRAYLMVFFCALSLARNRAGSVQDALIFALFVICLWTPTALFDLRLQLSALAVAAISLALPLLRLIGRGTAPDRKTGRSWHTLRQAGVLLTVSLVTQVALLPLTASAFGSAALWLPLNLLWLPVLGIVVMPLAFAGLFCAALNLCLPAAWCFQAAMLPCQGLLELLAWMQDIGVLIAPAVLRPHWLAAAGFWLLLSLLPILWSGRRKTVMGVLLVVSLVLLALPVLERSKASESVTLRVMDVGQGQALLVEWQGRRTLIDGGGFTLAGFDTGRHVLAPALTHNRPPYLELVANTHPDTDHLRGLLDLMDRFQVDGFLHAAGEIHKAGDMDVRDAILSRRAIAVRQVSRGDRLALGEGLGLEVLHPSRQARGSANNRSLVLRLVWDGRPLALVCGDIERSGLHEILATGRDVKADVLVLPHHGSRGSLSPEFYRQTAPDLALVSCGHGNQWGFPAQAVRDELDRLGIPLLGTPEHGQISVTWHPNGSRSVNGARSGPLSVFQLNPDR